MSDEKEREHSPEERLWLFLMGFRRGAGMRVGPVNFGDPDFMNGYHEGANALYVAIEMHRAFSTEASRERQDKGQDDDEQE